MLIQQIDAAYSRRLFQINWIANYVDIVTVGTRNLNRKVSFLALSAFILLSLADLVLTRVLLVQSGGDIYEANPVASTIITQLGWSALTLYKLALVSLVSGIVLFVGHYRPVTARRLLLFACMLMTGVVTYSTYLFVWVI